MLYQVAGILICLQLFKKPIRKCFIKWQAYLFACNYLKSPSVNALSSGRHTYLPAII